MVFEAGAKSVVNWLGLLHCRHDILDDAGRKLQGEIADVKPGRVVNERYLDPHRVSANVSMVTREQLNHPGRVRKLRDNLFYDSIGVNQLNQVFTTVAVAYIVAECDRQ